MKNRFYKNLQKRYHIRREKPQLWKFPSCGFGYIQIPKVATRSIRDAFGNSPQLGADQYATFDAFEDQNSLHIKQDKIRSQCEGLFVFAFVRDPLARLYSAYTNKVVDGEKRGKPCIFDCHGIQYGMSFDEFTKRVCTIPDRKINRHLRSQAWFLCNSNGDTIPDLVGHLEQCATDWKHLCGQLPALSPVPHKNKASHGKDFMSAYSSDTERMARERYAEDFVRFGY